jgi:hypothetical protein
MSLFILWFRKFVAPLNGSFASEFDSHLGTPCSDTIGDHWEPELLDHLSQCPLKPPKGKKHDQPTMLDWCNALKIGFKSCTLAKRDEWTLQVLTVAILAQTLGFPPFTRGLLAIPRVVVYLACNVFGSASERNDAASGR